MDVFGRRARRERDLFAVALSEMMAQRNLALDAWEAERALVLAAQTIVSHKDAQMSALQAQIADLREELASRPEKRPAISSGPLYLNEQEEDIEYAFKNELIDKQTYEDMLAQLQFDNTEITFDYS